MKILVPTKRVPDTDQKIIASGDGSRVVVDHIPFAINPFDAIALEAAVRISESPEFAAEVVAVGIGGSEYVQQLRTALALGAGRAIHILHGGSLDPWSVAQLLRRVVEQEQPELVLMGKQAVDDDAGQTGQFLAALLDWPQATFASRLEFSDGEVIVDRETDHGIETIQLRLPAIITVDLGLNEPRYASMAGIMKARTKPLEVLAASDLNVDLQPRVEVVRYRATATRNRGERLNSVDELVDRLTRPGAVLHNRI